MLVRVTKLLISLGFHAFSESRRAVLRLFGRQLDGSGVVLYYHHVLREHRERFARQMEHLKRTVQSLPAGHEDPLPAGTRAAAVTFDDGYLSVLENAKPVLERLGIPATAFVIPDFLGATLKDDPSERCMAAGELRKLASPLIVIGSHTSRHTRMTTVNEEEGRYELQGSKQKLEKLLGCEVAEFCFPFGAYNEETLRWCASAGYRRVFTCDPTTAFSRSGQSVVGRVAVEPTDWPLEFRLKMVGAYSWLPLAFEVKRTLLRRVKRTKKESAVASANPARN